MKGQEHGNETVAQTIESLDNDVRRTLAAAHDAPPEVAAMLISTLGYWVRVLLSEERVIESFEDEKNRGSGTDEAKERPARIALTDHGRAVMAACAQLVGADSDLEARAEQLNEAHDDYLASLEDDADAVVGGEAGGVARA